MQKIILVFLLLMFSSCIAREQASTYVSGTASGQDIGPVYEAHPLYFNRTFSSITENIPRLSELGIKTIYLMPIYSEPQGFPTTTDLHARNIYRIPDYYSIDPLYGSDSDLQELVRSAHDHGMKVIFDLVPSNTPEGSVIFNNGWIHKIPLDELKALAQKANVPLEYSQMNSQQYVSAGCITRQNRKLCEASGLVDGSEVLLQHFPRAEWGYAQDYTNPGLISYYTNLTKDFIRKYGIDGWRIDAPGDNWNPRIIRGDHSITQLLMAVRDAGKSIKPDFFLYCETPYVARTQNPPPVLDNVCETSYSHVLVTDVQDRSAQTSPGKLLGDLGAEGIWNNASRSRFAESHDTDRVASVQPGIERPVAVLVSTLPGVPMIQAGQEIGARGRYGLSTMADWKGGDYSLQAFYKEVFTIRQEHDALRSGSMSGILKSGSIIAFARKSRDETVVVAVNPTGRSAESTLDMPFPENTRLRNLLGSEEYISSPEFRLSLQPYGSAIIVRE